MSTGKRLAKRSILGTRIVAPGQDGRFYPATIQAVRSTEADRLARQPTRYTVRFDNSRKVSEYLETQLIGPGFSGVARDTQLMAGQRVYLTHVGREMEATIMSHDPVSDQLIVNISNGLQLKVRLDDIRLLESRKSSRLMNQTQDFSKLADFNIVHERKRLNSEKSSDGSDFLGSRKRRGSETLSEEEERSSGDETGAGSRLRRGRRLGHKLRKDQRRRGEECPGAEKKMFRMRRSGSPVIMTECTAAMVLMDLSCSPASRGRMSHASGHSDASSGQMSPSSSGVSSLGTSWSCPSPSPTLTPPFPLPPTDSEDPVEALLQLAAAANSRAQCSLSTSGSASQGPSGQAQVNPVTGEQESDEGIVSDQSNEFEDKKTEGVQTIYQCTWPGCHVTKDLCADIEKHVREKHLRRPAPSRPEDDDHEEEFYYNEIDIPVSLTSLNRTKSVSLCKPAPSAQTPSDKTIVITTSSKNGAKTTQGPVLSDHMDMARPPHENPEYTGGQRPILPGPAIATIISSNWTGKEAQAPATPAASGSTTATKVITASPASLNTSEVKREVATPVSSTGLMHAVPIAIPITTFTIASGQHSPGKYIRLSPKPFTSAPKSPLRRPRGDAKKCRKVYGMEHRELWCTQCKWKKACTRFGEGA